MKSNANEFRRTVAEIGSFGFTNHALFKRFKHGGLTVICDISANGINEYFDKFESFNAVIVGDNPLKDVVPIPYSKEVMESYEILIGGLQKMIKDIVSNRIGCIQRRIDGVIPDLIYNVETITIDKTVMDKSIASFYEANPPVPITTHLNFNVELAKESVAWYQNLDKFMTECRKRKQVSEEYKYQNGIF
jgi:hypothetical protein